MLLNKQLGAFLRVQPPNQVGHVALLVGKGCGRRGAKRQPKASHTTAMGFANSAIRRLARRGGVERIAGVMYEETYATQPTPFGMGTLECLVFNQFEEVSSLFLHLSGQHMRPKDRMNSQLMIDVFYSKTQAGVASVIDMIDTGKLNEDELGIERDEIAAFLEYITVWGNAHHAFDGSMHIEKAILVVGRLVEYLERNRAALLEFSKDKSPVEEAGSVSVGLLKAAELREELAKRNLDTAGLKVELAERLTSARAKEAAVVSDISMFNTTDNWVTANTIGTWKTTLRSLKLSVKFIGEKYGPRAAEYLARCYLEYWGTNLVENHFSGQRRSVCG